MKINVDWNLCDGNGACVLAAPRVFDLDDDDELVLLQPEPAESEATAVREAVRACPKHALAVTEA